MSSSSSSANSKSFPSSNSSWQNEFDAFFFSRRLMIALECPSTRPSLWDSLIKKALSFVPELVETNPETNIVVHENWNLMFRLFKAAYLAQENESSSAYLAQENESPSLLSLTQPRTTRITATEFPAEGALHAILGLIYPFTISDQKHESVSIALVVQHLIHNHPMELYRLSPAGRFPLHVICATPCSTKTRQNLLCTVLQARPEVASIPDGQGIYPLHLACQAGYPFEPTLELLWTTAPYIAELSCPCCPQQLLHQHTIKVSCLSSSPLSSVSLSSISSASQFSTQQDDDDDDNNKNDEQGLTTVYSAMQSEPH